MFMNESSYELFESMQLFGERLNSAINKRTSAA